MTQEKNLEELLEKFQSETQDILTPRERDCIRLRFGFDDGKPRTFEEIGELFGITAKETAKIIKAAMKKAERNELFRNIMQIIGYKILFCTIFAEFIKVLNDKMNELIDLVDGCLNNSEKAEDLSGDNIDQTESDERIPRRESEVLRYRCGIADGEQKSLSAIAKIMGISPERVRQIEAKGLRMLRHPKRSKKLRDFIIKTEEQ